MAATETQSLMLETLRLLRDRHETLPEIQMATGIPFYWLRKFLGEEFRDPSVNRVQKLYEYLARRKLAV